ncbi:hypothetical protein Ancab_023809 [Ancistrocladus abbreviatus]
MGMKVKLFPSLLPSCNQPKTLSFRAKEHHHDIFKTLNSVYCDINGVETPKSWFTETSDSVSFSTESEVAQGGELGESIEAIIRGVQSQSSRLFFEPGGETSSILDQEANTKSIKIDYYGNEEEGFGRNDDVVMNGNNPFESSVVMAMESVDPYEDFRRSMEEMVEIHGLMRDWRCMEELLSWYLRVNGKKNHGYIVGAFVDLLVGVASKSPMENSSSGGSVCCEAKSTTSFSSAATSFSFRSPSSSLDQNEIC